MSDLKPKYTHSFEKLESVFRDDKGFEVHSNEIISALSERDSLRSERISLKSQIDQLKTQLSGITQYGSIEAAEKIDCLTKERDEARNLAQINRDLYEFQRGDYTGNLRLMSHKLLPWENKTT